MKKKSDKVAALAVAVINVNKKNGIVIFSNAEVGLNDLLGDIEKKMWGK